MQRGERGDLAPPVGSAGLAAYSPIPTPFHFPFHSPGQGQEVGWKPWLCRTGRRAAAAAACFLGSWRRRLLRRATKIPPSRPCNLVPYAPLRSPDWEWVGQVGVRVAGRVAAKGSTCLDVLPHPTARANKATGSPDCVRPVMRFSTAVCSRRAKLHARTRSRHPAESLTPQLSSLARTALACAF